MKVLIVSPLFPPSASVAIVRISSLVRELLNEGHEVTVIRNEYNEEIHQLSDNYPDLLKLETYTVKVDRSVRYFEACKRYKKVFRQIMDKTRFDVVFITAGPYYTIPLCKIAKKEYGTKCIIDYRDLWIFDMRSKKDFFKPLNLAKKLVYFPLELNNLKYADLVVTVTENWRKILSKVYRKYRDKFKVISNGYDDVQLKKINHEIEYPFYDNFVITAFGKLSYYSVEYGVEFFSAMKVLSEKYPDLLVLHIGLPEKETKEAIKLSGFNEKKYINTGFINYSEGIQILKKSNVNVVIDIRKGAMGTKFYDYIYVNKPLLYLGKKNTQLKNLVNEFENGFICYNEYDLVRAIINIRENKINTLTNNINVHKYSRSIQNKRYIELISQVLKY